MRYGGGGGGIFTPDIIELVQRDAASETATLPDANPCMDLFPSPSLSLTHIPPGSKILLHGTPLRYTKSRRLCEKRLADDDDDVGDIEEEDIEATAEGLKSMLLDCPGILSFSAYSELHLYTSSNDSPPLSLPFSSWLPTSLTFEEEMSRRLSRPLSFVLIRTFPERMAGETIGNPIMLSQVANLSPKHPRRISATTFCCDTLQCISRERMRGVEDAAVLALIGNLCVAVGGSPTKNPYWESARVTSRSGILEVRVPPWVTTGSPRPPAPPHVKGPSHTSSSTHLQPFDSAKR